MSTLAEVRLWGSRIGAVLLEDAAQFAVFEYDPDFIRSGIQVAPLQMPLGPRRYSFPGLALGTFEGLPGMLADSLPDRYGRALIDTWLASQGRPAASFDAVERLCYTGRRGMGALEFEPVSGPRYSHAEDLHIAALVELASDVLTNREELVASLARGEREGAMRQILAVGTSAGGARAKALIAWNPATNQVRSGQVEADAGFEHWLLKFDGVEGNKDKERLADPQGFGAIEFAYSEMARAAGIEMTACRLLEEDGRRHFMTRRFDRDERGGKLHMQSLSGLAHFDFNLAGAYSYEQALNVVRELALPKHASEQLYRRMVFNVVARNQDDHVKNVAFLMDRSGRWSLAPAFDLSYAHNPQGSWTNRHQMTVNGKRDDFTLADLRAVGRHALLTRRLADDIVAEVRDAVGRWLEYAREADVDEQRAQAIGRSLRLALPA